MPKLQKLAAMGKKKLARRGAHSTAETQTHEPGWRQPPPKRRRKARRSQTTALRLTRPDLRKAGSQVLRSVAGLRRVRVDWRLVGLLPVLALLIFGLVQVFGGYDFYVYGAEITGNERVSTESIYEASDVDQKNILWVNTGSVAQRVEALPGIASARVHVSLPNRVLIEVAEEEPVLQWQTGQDTVWVAADGSTLAPVGTAPALVLVDPETAAAGTDGQLHPALLSDIQAIRAGLPELTHLYYGAKEGLYFRAPEGWTVYLGNQGDITNKMALLRTLQRDIAARAAPPSVVDLRVEGNAYLR